MSTGKPINVSLRVIADLSQGLYRSPADALKELISNAYDADSPKVEINFSQNYNQIIVKDWGKGMTINDFVEIMETIGGSSKRAADTGNLENTKSGRKIVGRIGIGLLSVSQIAATLEIESKTENSDKGFKGKIQFDQFASEEARKIKITELWESDNQIEIGKYFITEVKGLAKTQHFTTMRLTGIKKTLLDNLKKEKEIDGYPRLLGKNFNNVEKFFYFMRDNLITKTALHEYDRIIWELCVLCPVPYLDKTLKIYNRVHDSTSTKSFHDFTLKINKETHFKLYVDGIECFKPIKMPIKIDRDYSLFFNLLFMKGLNDRNITYLDYDKENKLIKKKIEVKGYFYFQRPKIWPPEMQGIIIRVRNVAVGLYDSTFLNYRRHEGFKFSQLTGEIFVDELDNALNIDRSSFRETEPSYVAFRNAIHSYLGNCVFPGIKNYATTERNERTIVHFNEEEKNLSQIFKKIDNRRVCFTNEVEKFIERDKNKIIISRYINGKKFKYGFDFYKFILFMEAKLKRKLTNSERDELYESFIKWWGEN